MILCTMWKMACLRVAGSSDCAAKSFFRFTDGAFAIVQAIVTKVLDVVSGQCASGHDSNRSRNLLHLFLVIFCFIKKLNSILSNYL